MLERSVGDKCCREVLTGSVVYREVLLGKSVVEKGVLWRRIVGEKCQQGRLLRFAVSVELMLQPKRCWMGCALESTSFGVKKEQ